MKTRVLFIRELLSFWIIYHCCSIYECPGPTIPFSKKEYLQQENDSVYFCVQFTVLLPSFCRCQLFKQEEWMKEGRTRHSFFISRSHRRETPLM